MTSAPAPPPLPTEPDSSVQSKDGVGGGHRGTPRARHRKNTRSRIFRELVHIAAEQGATIKLGVSTGDALQECLDRAVALWRFAADQVDHLYVTDIDHLDDAASLPDSTGDEGPEAASPHLSLANLPAEEDPTFEVLKNPQGPDLIEEHRWIKREAEARREIEKLAAMMTQLGIAERVVRVEEAKAALIVAAVMEAAQEIGLSHDTVRALGAALRARVADAQDKVTQANVRKDVATGTTPREAYYAANRTEKAIEAGA